MADLRTELAEVLADAISRELYESLMAATADHWRQWEYLTDAAKERYQAEGARIVADAILASPALAAHVRAERAGAVREAAEAAQDIATKATERASNEWTIGTQFALESRAKDWCAVRDWLRDRADRIEAGQ